MEWVQHGERTIYASNWVALALVDVELPSGKRFEHHVIRAPRPASGTIVHDPDRGFLMLWRHRFATDTWGWEIPAGRVDEGEEPIEAAHRECLEETGWRPGPLTHLIGYHPNNGQSDQIFHLFLAHGATRVGDPTDIDEASKVEWLSHDEIREEIAAGRVLDGMSLTGLLWVLAAEAVTEQRR